MKTLYIAQLETSTQSQILEELKGLGFDQYELEAALNGRLCDLEDTINIRKYIN